LQTLRKTLSLAMLLVVFIGLNPGQALQEGWLIEGVERGTKPALTLDTSGNPVIAHMLERRGGFVKAATRGERGWTSALVAEGYFYGPLDVATDPEGRIHVIYHDHQAPNFNPNIGDLAHAVRQDAGWTVEPLANRGHDGWDGRLVFDANGALHASAVDPLDFNGRGVEYYLLTPEGELVVEAVGSEPQTYRFATAIAFGPDGAPRISYFDLNASRLVLATRAGPDDWTLETVDDAAGTGAFSSLKIDREGGVHISYFESDGGPAFADAGRIKYAFRPNPDTPWQIEVIDTLDQVFSGFAGARNITSLALDSDGNPWVAYSDESVLKLARFDGQDWRIQTVVEAGERPLGQLVSLVLDAHDRPHLTYHEVTNKDPLDGVVFYATPTEMP